MIILPLRLLFIDMLLMLRCHIAMLLPP